MNRISRCIVAIWSAFALNAIPIANAETKHDRFYFERLGYAHWQVKTEEKVVALTFDDGPDPTYTPKVLHLLDEYHDHGTFFVIGRKVEQFPNITREIYEFGNEIGNHTYTHSHLRHMTAEVLRKEMSQTATAIRDATGQSPSCFRPPRGFYNDLSVRTAHQAGYSVILWSWDEDSRDWETPGVQKIVQTVIDHLHPGDIILLHDGTGNNKQTVSALHTILPLLHQRGYKSVTVTKLLESSEPEDD